MKMRKCRIHVSLLNFYNRKLSSSVEPLSSFNPLIKSRKKKYTIVKRSFPSKNEPPIVLEQKEASNVMKQLNFEFSKLYGPVQISKHDHPKQIKSSYNIIQNCTSIPITDNFLVTSQPAVKESNSNLSVTTPDLEVILDFPLINDPILIQPKSEILVTKMNNLKAHLGSKRLFKYPSISNILQKTMPEESKENLKRWEEKMISEMGVKAFQKYKEELLQNGIALHSTINDYLTSVPENELSVKEANAGHWESLKAVFPYISDVKLLEERLCHPFLCYKGVIDCFAKYRGQLVAIDWKTSKKKKTSLSSTFDNPLQLAAYVGALNFDPKFQYMVTKGLIVVAYENGDPASAHFMDQTVTLRYWKEWLARVKMFWKMEEQAALSRS